jgi:hypothetical protein
VEDDRRRVATGGERRPEPVALFFGGARITGPILVLVFWAALGSLLALALGGRIMNPVDTEAAAAAGAAV